MDETGCGLIQLKSEVFLEKKYERDKDGGLISWKLKVLFANFLQPALLVCGLISLFFCKMTWESTIWVAHPADPTAGNGRWHRLLPWPRNWPGFVGRDAYKILFIEWNSVEKTNKTMIPAKKKERSFSNWRALAGSPLDATYSLRPKIYAILEPSTQISARCKITKILCLLWWVDEV